MDRLTGRDPQANTPHYVECFDEPCLGMGCQDPQCTHALAACDRLAAYEDTGLTPENVREVISILRRAGFKYRGGVK